MRGERAQRRRVCVGRLRQHLREPRGLHRQLQGAQRRGVGARAERVRGTLLLIVPVLLPGVVEGGEGIGAATASGALTLRRRGRGRRRGGPCGCGRRLSLLPLDALHERLGLAAAATSVAEPPVGLADHPGLNRRRLARRLLLLLALVALREHPALVLYARLLLGVVHLLLLALVLLEAPPLGDLCTGRGGGAASLTA